MIGPRDAQSSVVFPKVACIRRVEMTIEHQRRAVAGPAHRSYDIGSSFFYFLKLRFDTGLAHVFIEKASALQLFAFRTGNIHHLLDQVYRLVWLEGVNDCFANIFFHL